MKEDPLHAFVSRSLRAEVSDVRSEVIAKDPRRELERIRFRQDGGERTLILQRVPADEAWNFTSAPVPVPADEALETQLLPFLARRTDRVPAVRSRGIPPPTVPAWPWVLVEDVVDAPSACERDPRDIVRAKVTVEQAVRSDVPALRALGVPAFAPADLVARVPRQTGRAIGAGARGAAAALGALPVVLAHGDLVCANTRDTERGVVLLEWRRAHLGCGLLDVARLVSDLRAWDERTKTEELFALYGQLSGQRFDSEAIRAAELVDEAIHAATTY